jgi:hypothetical protein
LIDDTIADIIWICTTEESLGCSEQKFQKAASSAPNATSQDGTAFQYGSAVRTNQILRRMRKVAFFVLYGDAHPTWPQADMRTTFHTIRYYADDVRTDFGILYETVAGCLLPIFFAALGAVTFGLRDLRQRLETRTWVPQGTALPFLRVIIAAAAGFMLSLFSDFSTKSGLTPIALAFIIGYSVDVFFTFIDSIVLRFKTPITTPPKPAGA